MILFAFFPILAYHSSSMDEIPFTLEQRLYLAEQVGRRIGCVDQAWVMRLAGRFRKKFLVKTPSQQVLKILEEFSYIFSTACTLLPGFVHPPQAGEISLADVDEAQFLTALQAQYPIEDPQILDELMGWATIYNYLH